MWVCCFYTEINEGVRKNEEDILTTRFDFNSNMWWHNMTTGSRILVRALYDRFSGHEFCEEVFISVVRNGPRPVIVLEDFGPSAACNEVCKATEMPIQDKRLVSILHCASHSTQLPHTFLSS